RKNLNNQRNYKINQLVNRKSFYSDKEISTQSEKIDQLMTGSLIYGNSILLFMVHEAEYQHVLWVKQKLDYFLQNNLKIKKDEKNFQIINLFKESFQFVGYEILVRKEKTFFKISISHIVNLLLRYKFIKYRKNGALRPISQTKLLAQPDFKIIQAYNYIVQCLTSYYSGISSNKRLQYCEYLLKFSCAMTLAHKHKTSISKIFRNHGSNLSLHSQPIENSYQFKSQHQNYLNIWQTTESFLDPFIIY
ncbi:MAG: group II intron reverse transcriptase/maturase, partial [Pseudomonadota bacterium]